MFTKNNLKNHWSRLPKKNEWREYYQEKLSQRYGYLYEETKVT